MRPILFHVGPFPVRAYGTMVIIGFLLALWRGINVAKRSMITEPIGSPRRIDPDIGFDLALYGLGFGILGARVLYVLLDWSQYAAHPLDAVKIWQGGLSYHGAMIGGLTFLWFFCRRHKLSFLAVGDVTAPSWAIAYAFGRIGCLLNGCCYGGVCDLPWAVRFPDERFPVAAGQPPILTAPSHPIQAYAFIINLFFFWLLTRWERLPRRDGEIFFGYIALYGIYRFGVETLRAGVTSTYLIPSLHLTDTHIVSIIMVIAGICGIAILRRVRPAVPSRLSQPTAAA